MKKGTVLVLLSSLLVFSACATNASRTGSGLLFDSFQESGTATTATSTDKSGSACSYNILGLFSVGDSSVDRAKYKGNVKSVSSVDYEYLNILHLFASVCTIVKGS